MAVGTDTPHLFGATGLRDSNVTDPGGSEADGQHFRGEAGGNAGGTGLVEVGRALWANLMTRIRALENSGANRDDKLMTNPVETGPRTREALVGLWS
jgi:hypothetical protein